MIKYLLQIGVMNDSTYIGVSRLVSRFAPFAHYSFQLMLDKLAEQLINKSNVMMVVNGRIVAYAGWINITAEVAHHWYSHGGELPPPNWQHGEAAIVTIVVTQDSRYLIPLIKAVSHVCAGKKVYRLRSFQDGRMDMRRPPIVGRLHSNLKTQ
jgi:hypothetical protein